jgi:hypothetical protein
MRRRAPGLIMDRSKKAAYAMIKVRSRMLCWRWRGKVVGGEEVRVPCYAGLLELAVADW